MKKALLFAFKLLPLVALTSGILLATPTLELQLSSGASTVTVADNGPGDLSPVAGLISYSGAVGQWDLNVETATSYPAAGSTSDPTMSLQSTNLAASGADPLTIMFSVAGFTGPLPSGEALLSAQSGLQNIFGTSTADGTTQLSVYYDPGNTLFATTDQLGSTFNTSGESYSNSFVTPLSASSYSLTLVAVITHSVSSGETGYSQVNMDESVVPEPGFYGLLALGVGGLILVAQRRKKARPGVQP